MFPPARPPRLTSPQYTGSAGNCNLGSRITPFVESFMGSISAVYMYNRALSSTEIATLYSATSRIF